MTVFELAFSTRRVEKKQATAVPMPSPSASATPTAGFVVKLKAPDGTRHYANICSHPAIQRPLNPADQEVEDGVLRTRGIDNLRVPLLLSPVRTVALGGDDDEEAVCFDVMFNSAVLDVALPGGASEDANSAAAAHGIDPALSKMVRMRLVELALSHAEQDLGYKLGRAYTLPKNASYKGGVGGGRQPVPCQALRNLISAQEAAELQAQQHAAAGPWKSKREAAGQTTRAKIEELASFEDDRLEERRQQPLIKKGFLSAQSAKGRHLYPNGSEEGMLYGDVKVAGDPLGYLPKGLRSRVKVVDPATTTPEQQQQMMEDYANGSGPRRPSATAGAANSTKGGGGGGGGGAGNLNKGFLNGAGGSLYPNGSAESGGGKPSAEAALNELIPSTAELERIASETDSDTFLKELSGMASLLGLGSSGGPSAWPPSDAGGLGGLTSGDLFSGEGPVHAAKRESLRQHYETGYSGHSSGGGGAASASARSDERRPEHELLDSGVDEPVVLKVSLPALESLEGVEVDISEDHFRLVAPNAYRLELSWPRPMDADAAKAKFLKKSHTLQVTVPPAAV